MTAEELKKQQLKNIKAAFGVDEKYLIITGNKVKVDVAGLECDGFKVTAPSPFKDGDLFKFQSAAGKIAKVL